MEVVEICQEKNPVKTNQKKCPNVKCTKRYVQPPVVKAFLPPRAYCPPQNPIDSRTTYLCSYFTENQPECRPDAIRPSHNIYLSKDKITDDTTTKLSFKPVWGICKAKMAFPLQRLCPNKGPMEGTTTIRQDYAPKYAPKQGLIQPRGHISTSKATFEGTTTTELSYLNPGPVEPAKSYKPELYYCRPSEPTASETTQKLSYLPYQVGKKENYPWAIKPPYRRPEISMPRETTYTKSYLINKTKRQGLILPRDTGVLPCGTEFADCTVYRESFFPCKTDPVAPILPRGNICISDKKMTCDTTNKLSFQPVKGEKRKPMVPRRRKILSDMGYIRNISTTQEEFTPKVIKRTKLIVPRGHIHTAEQPLEGKTTTALSFLNPGPAIPIQSYKPQLQYCRPEQKLEVETVNKMSYPKWSIEPKEKLPWARKQHLHPLSGKMPTSTVYHMSFPAPGHFIECEETETNECSCTPDDNCEH